MKKRRRGRPASSEIRQNLVDLLYFLKECHGYRLSKAYNAIFPKCTERVIYYHLKKGLALGKFSIKKIKQEKGSFSWGPVSEKIIYCLGKNAKPRLKTRLRDAVEKLKQLKML